jgi:hypothetical protein
VDWELRFLQRPVPPSRIAALSRFANTVKVSAVARLPDARRVATLVAFIHSLEASAHDDALDVLAILLRDLFAKAEQADRRVRLRTLKDLDHAASTLVSVPSSHSSSSRKRRANRSLLLWMLRRKLASKEGDPEF